MLASSVGRSLAFACLDKLRGSAEERLEFDVAFEVDGEGHVVEVKVEPEGPSSAILQTCLDELSTKALLPPPDHPPGKVRSLLAVNNRAAGARPPAPSFIDVTQAYRVLDLDVQFYRHQDREVPRGFVEYDIRNAFITTNAILVLVDVEKPNYPQEDDDSVLEVMLDAHDGNPIESRVRLRHFATGAGRKLTIPVLLYPNRALCDMVTVRAKAVPSGPDSEAGLEVPFTCGE